MKIPYRLRGSLRRSGRERPGRERPGRERPRRQLQAVFGRRERPNVKPKAPRRPRMRRGLRRGAYILPSLFTIGNLLLGFFAVILGLKGSFETAVVAILVAGILDALDGFVARLTHTESEFGREFDSLADVMTFGAAPAFLAYLWGLEAYGRAGWLVPLFFLMCTAIRLARFNVQTTKVDSRFFVGLPSPAGAGAILALIFSAPGRVEWEAWVSWATPMVAEGVMFGALIVVGALMVSTFRYPSLKKIHLRRRFSYRTFLVLGAVILVLAYRPVALLLGGAILYPLVGPVLWLFGRRRRQDEATDSGSETSSGSAAV